jgi:CO/xanthine dehydrogenase Mo-binding subunit
MNVNRAWLRTERGFVVHDASRQRLSYGELTTAAAALPIPADVPLKKTTDFKIIGTATKRTDGRDIVTGKAKYGIDVKVPGMRYATIVRPPVLGGSVKSFDATRAKKIQGVRDVVKVSAGVAIVADNSWAALKARDVLDLELEPGPHAAFSSAVHAQRMAEAGKQGGFVTRRDGDHAVVPVVKQLQAVYQYPVYAHATLETMNTIADVGE